MTAARMNERTSAGPAGLRPLPDDDEDAGADDGADAEGGQAERTHGLLQLFAGTVGLLDQAGDVAGDEQVLELQVAPPRSSVPDSELDLVARPWLCTVPAGAG